MADEQQFTPPTPMVPHVCMTCGDAKGVVPGWGQPYCQNHGQVGILMVPFPLERLRKLLGGAA